MLCEIVPALYPIGPDPEMPVTKDTGIDPVLIVPSVVTDVDPAQDVRSVISAVPMARTVFTCDAVSAAGVAAEALAFPMIVFGLMADMFVIVTTPAASVVAIDVAPDPVTAPESVIVWLPVKYVCESVSTPDPLTVASPLIDTNPNVDGDVASRTCPAVLPEIVCDPESRTCASGMRASLKRTSLPTHAVVSVVP